MTSPVPESSKPPEEKRWWVAIRQKAEGPYTAEQIIGFVRTCAIPADAQACLVGTRQWAPLSDWPEFADASSLVPPPLPPSIVSVDSHPLTNRQLPSMANWVCVYCIGLRPVICALGLVAAIMTGGTGPSGRMTANDVFGFLVFAVTTLAITTALVIGGVRLRNLRESGPDNHQIGDLGKSRLRGTGLGLRSFVSDGEQQSPATADLSTCNDRSESVRLARLPA